MRAQAVSVSRQPRHAPGNIPTASCLKLSCSGPLSARRLELTLSRQPDTPKGCEIFGRSGHGMMGWRGGEQLRRWSRRERTAGICIAATSVGEFALGHNSMTHGITATGV